MANLMNLGVSFLPVKHDCSRPAKTAMTTYNFMVLR